MAIESFENFLEAVKLAEIYIRVDQGFDLPGNCVEMEDGHVEQPTYKIIPAAVLEAFRDFFLWAVTKVENREQKQQLQEAAAWWNSWVTEAQQEDERGIYLSLDEVYGEGETLGVLLALKNTYQQHLVDEWAKSKGVRL